MKHNHPHRRILAIAPSSRGFGFALLETPRTLVDWGTKAVAGEKNAQSLLKFEGLIAQYRPTVVVVPDSSHRAKRIQSLVSAIIDMGQSHKIAVATLSRQQVGQVLLPNRKLTKYAIAQFVAQQFPDELSSRLPPQRKPWMSEDFRMAMFEAVSLALALPAP